MPPFRLHRHSRLPRPSDASPPPCSRTLYFPPLSISISIAGGLLSAPLCKGVGCLAHRRCSINICGMNGWRACTFRLIGLIPSLTALHPGATHRELDSLPHSPQSPSVYSRSSPKSCTFRCQPRSPLGYRPCSSSSARLLACLGQPTQPWIRLTETFPILPLSSAERCSTWLCHG